MHALGWDSSDYDYPKRKFIQRVSFFIAKLSNVSDSYHFCLNLFYFQFQHHTNKYKRRQTIREHQGAEAHKRCHKQHAHNMIGYMAEQKQYFNYDQFGIFF